MLLPNARLVGKAMRISSRVLRVFPSLGKFGNLSTDIGDATDDACKKWIYNLLSNFESN